MRRFLEIARVVHEYFLQSRSIGHFALVTDVTMKSDEKPTELAQADFSGPIIGIETGHDETLTFMSKGYATADIVKQCRRLNAAGIGILFLPGRYCRKRTRNRERTGNNKDMQPDEPMAYWHQRAHGVPELEAVPRDGEGALGRSR